MPLTKETPKWCTLLPKKLVFQSRPVLKQRDSSVIIDSTAKLDRWIESYSQLRMHCPWIPICWLSSNLCNLSISATKSASEFLFCLPEIWSDHQPQEDSQPNPWLSCKWDNTSLRLDTAATVFGRLEKCAWSNKHFTTGTTKSSNQCSPLWFAFMDKVYPWCNLERQD